MRLTRFSVFVKNFKASFVLSSSAVKTTSKLFVSRFIIPETFIATDGRKQIWFVSVFLRSSRWLRQPLSN